MNDSQVSKDSDAKRDASTNGTAAKVNNDGATEATPPAHTGAPKRKKKGCGCLVMLAITVFVGLIGLITRLPLLLVFVVLAQYSAEAVPVFGNLRTKIEEYRIENGRLPGLEQNADGTFGKTSQLADGQSRVQTFSGTNDAVFTADFGDVVAVTNGNHAFREIDVHWSDLTGKRLRPKHIQYRSDMCHEESRLHVLGAFGDGEGYGVGTGYAALEINNTTAQVKAIGVWERYKPLAKEPKQIIMVNADEARRYFDCKTPEQARRMNLCWVGDTEALMSGDKARVERALEELRKAGWEW